jgi:hypothetical protein
MADTSGEQDIRGINIDKLAKGFGEVENVLKRFVVNSKTSAREIRWYQKTSGFLDSVKTTAVTGSRIRNVAERALPSVVEQSWTRRTSYVQKYFVESPTISMEDVKDSDIDVLAGNVRDLVRAVARQVDQRIFAVLTEANAATPTIPNPSTVNTAAATGTGWDDALNGNPVLDILAGKQKIYAAGYNPEGCILAMNSIEHRNLINYLITVKGSSIPAFSSEKVRSGVVMEILGCNVVVNENITTDYAVMWVPDRAATWKSFVPITSFVIDDPGIGKKIRVWEEGECLLTDPLAVHVITDTVT